MRSCERTTRGTGERAGLTKRRADELTARAEGRIELTLCARLLARSLARAQEKAPPEAVGSSSAAAAKPKVRSLWACSDEEAASGKPPRPSSNRTLVLLGPKKVGLQDRAYPAMSVPAEKGGHAVEHGVVLKVVATNICGTDLHLVSLLAAPLAHSHTRCMRESFVQATSASRQLEELERGELSSLCARLLLLFGFRSVSRHDRRRHARHGAGPRGHWTGQGAHAHLNKETRARRGELVTVLMSRLGLPGPCSLTAVQSRLPSLLADRGDGSRCGAL